MTTTWKQTAGFSSGSLFIDGATSDRERLFFDGDNVSAPPLRGRIDMDLGTCSSQKTVIASVGNPTTEELWVEKVIVNIDTASSSSCALSMGIATADSSSASNCAEATVACSTAGLLGLNSSGTFPVAWNATSYFTITAVTSSGIPLAVVGDVSVFYVSAVTT